MSATTSLRYSQNFLRDPRLIAHLLTLTNIEPTDTVYEIGPGKGIITDQLAQRCRRVVAVEQDPLLAQALQRRYAGSTHVAIHTGDFLEFPLPREPYKVFANIPFNRTHEIITKLTGATSPPHTAYLAMQREAAQKFCGTPREYLYAILLKPWFEVDVVYQFQRSDFMPIPQVEAVLLRIQKRGPPLIAASERQLFRDFAVYGFTTRQPTLDRILWDIFTHRQRYHIEHNLAIDLATTPSTLTFPQWLQLFRYFQQVSSISARHIIADSEQRLLTQQARLEKIHRTRTPKRR